MILSTWGSEARKVFVGTCLFRVGFLFPDFVEILGRWVG